MDLNGQSGNAAPPDEGARQGDEAGRVNPTSNGHDAGGHRINGWAGTDEWSGAGAALEPAADSVVPTWRRGLDSQSDAQLPEPPSRYADILAAAGVRAPVSGPPQVNGVHPTKADLAAEQDAAEEAELTRRAADFARLSALEEPTPPQGTPSPFQRLLAVPPVSAPPIARLTPPSFTPIRPVTPPTQAGRPVSAPPVAPLSAPPAPPGLRPALPPDFSAPHAGPPSDQEPPSRPLSAPPSWAPVTPIPVSGPPLHRFGRPPEPPARPVEAVAERVDPGDDHLPHSEPALAQWVAEQRARLAEPLPAETAPAEPARTVAEPVIPSQQVQQPAAEAPIEPPADELIDQVPDEQGVLPQRVPAKPDVPPVPDEPVIPPPAAVLPTARDPELSRIASGLRRDEPPPLDRPDGFDVAAVLAAVKKVPGVRDAHLRAAPSGAHTLRLDLSDGADPGYVSRLVARMLAEKMGLSAEPPTPPERPATAEHPAPAEPPSQPDRPAESDPVAEVTPPPAPKPMLTPPTQRGATTLPPGLIPHPSSSDDPWSPPPREPRRRHPVTVRGRVPSELRPPSTGESSEEFNSAPTSPPLAPAQEQAPRVILDNVRVSTFGLDATVEVRLVTGAREAIGVARGPSVDAYVLRLCAVAAATAVDNLMTMADGGEPGTERGRCFVEHATLVPMGSCEVAVVVVLLVCGGWVEQLAGSALVSGDPRQAVVRATLAAVNRRLTALLP
ncbi:hypothetical protein F4553_004757 [Allocatelliglobosispora scoriae]|uniref:Uncharacterized protein n=1 Tax=Allocatelliglobosispora scoriae TaxID=643052 RepID=A0A841BVA6_9ACTN|nr:hypothetical protein [Allocatelliglobosispora scoriae]MBB5871378.1 hypothetical protein [Allocatelliglobosispora scoriae]